MNKSPLSHQRSNYLPKVPALLEELCYVALTPFSDESALPEGVATAFPLSASLQPLSALRHSTALACGPLRLGVLFSGGQAPGGHNVIAGLYDAIMQLNEMSSLVGFRGGPSGLMSQQYYDIDKEVVDSYRNQGGFDMIGSGRTRISSDEDFAKACEAVEALSLNGLVIIGGDDSNTNAAFLAEHFAKKGINTKVIGVPKTIDGDLKNSAIEISFGFDTAAKCYSDIIGNIARDALSAKKYYHFIKLMGRSASHIVLECALQTHPTYAILGEEVLAERKTFKDLVNELADLVVLRASRGKNYGVVLIPEGLIEFIPEFNQLIKELNGILAGDGDLQRLTQGSRDCYDSLPALIREQIMAERDPHGNVNVSKIETERLFIAAVEEELALRRSQGAFNGKFNALPHFLGYEGRSGFPSNFDCQYCYALGFTAALLVARGHSGYTCCVKNLSSHVTEWLCAAIPIVRMMDLEERGGVPRPVIKKALVDLQGAPFRTFAKERPAWQLDDLFRYPGPIQFGGLPQVSEAITLTLALEKSADNKPI